LYSWIKEDHPELYSSVQRAIHRGQWLPVGGMWVEADCNLTGAESLVRQFLLGRTFFRREFGAGSDSPVLWLPDVFGYAANLPQLMKQAGLRYFFSIKLGWNQYNRIPYDMFWWEGIDGTKVLTHFSTTKQPESAMVSTYNSDASPGQIMSTWTNFQQKDIGQSGSPPPLLMSYGYGDGGGGPTREMLENINILSEFPGAPRLKFSKAIDFYKELEQDVGEFLPTWQGELYLEYHRGTYTTQSRIKRANRKTEVLLHDAEFLCTAAAWSLDNFQYPKEELRRAWECHCLNQFHDILPGSSIGPVYEKALNQYEALTKDLIAVRNDALDALSENLGSPGASIVVNPSPFEQKLPVLIPVTDHSDSVLPYLVALEHQPVEEGILVDAGVLPPYSITRLSNLDVRSSEGASADYFSVSANHLENEYLKISFNEDGDIVSIFDKTQVRELVPHGELANEFQLFEDRPLAPDAWDIDKFYDDRMWTAEPASSINVVESGPLRAAVEIRRKALSSDLKQKISLYRSSPLISFETEVNWHEKRTLL
ncbi:MAG: alpha-mannosidase, partial [Candidatus Promineifilaceae bacterium]